ncbi:M20 family metallopeptidase [Halovenus marina]|uniref:M20 family metallopeptidase n=1 Tax=Halovenus marina TaxID=3396621 RepID=UPI003F5505F6
MTFDRNGFLTQAVEMPSHDSVAEMRDLLVETLEREGVESERDEAGNVLARRGSGDRTLVLNTHIDTVAPHVPIRENGDTLHGRGACDAKGPLAALLDAFLGADIESGTLVLAITPNEETTQTGGAHLGETLSADGYIVGEPTGLDVCRAARGQFEGQVTIRGVNAHAGNPGDGANAISAAAPILEALDSYDRERGPTEHDLLGRATLTPSAIEGGDVLNQVPAECTIKFDRRPVPPETIESFLDGLRAHLAGRLPDPFEVTVSPVRPGQPAPDAFETPADADLVRTLQETSGGEVRAFGAATEASYFADDAPTVVFGPGVLADDEGPVAHAEREYVSRAEVERAAVAVQEAVERLLA